MIHSTVQVIEDAWTDAGAWVDFAATMRQVLSLTDETLPGTAHAIWLPLPGLCCQAAGGDASLTKEITGAWACLQAAAHTLDKVEDQDPLDNWLEGATLGEAINAANGLVFTAFLLLNTLYQNEQTSRFAKDISEDFLLSILAMAGGQHRDLAMEHPDVINWHAIAEAKSGGFYRLACRCGARLGTIDEIKIEAFGRFGYHLGILLQLRDDLVDIRPGLEGKPSGEISRSLAVAYATTVLPKAEKIELETIIQSLREKQGGERQLADLLDRCGAATYINLEIKKQRKSGLDALLRAQPVQPAGDILSAMLQELSDI